MDGRERLRAYLEQRREMGESEFVLDGMSVAEALAAIDKLRPSKPTQSSRPSSFKAPVPSRGVAEKAVTSAPAVRASTVVPPTARPANTEPTRAETSAEVPAPAPAPASRSREPSGASSLPSFADGDLAAKFAQGLVVGSASGTLFEQNPYRDVGSLAELATIIEACTLCKLNETAKCAVPGDGNSDADFMCVGEAPGANEDETGRPFVGQAGGLLTKILAAIELSRDQVFITNVLKHRPPANRNPTPDEVKACSPYLVRQIQMVKPKVILALGTFAAQTLLETKTPIGKLRGAIHRY
ncbi:MAG: uracil-DNA glycosylase, partial [Gemmatimonadaceae bacterium]